VIGGLGAVAGAFLGLVYVLTPLLLGLRGSGGFNPFLFLLMGTGAGIAASCGLGITGAGFAIAGRPRTGAWLMLAGAAGVVASAYAYILLQPLAMGPAFEPYLSPGLFPDSFWHALHLFPVLPLFIGAVLAFLARRRAEG
jgi:hypothetical protein